MWSAYTVFLVILKIPLNGSQLTQIHLTESQPTAVPLTSILPLSYLQLLREFIVTVRREIYLFIYA